MNPDLLYLGTEFGAHASLDRGQSWFPLGDLPHVAVHEFAQPETADEVVAATHGRSLWIADVTALRGLDSKAREEGRVLLPVRDGHLDPRRYLERGSTIRRFEGQNPAAGPDLVYLLEEKADISLVIEDEAGELVREFEELSGDAGLHRVAWDLRGSRRDREGKLRSASRVGAGQYRAVLTVGDRRHVQPVVVRELD